MARKKIDTVTNGGLRELSLIREKIGAPRQYPFSIPALRHFKLLAFHPKVTYLSGENGMGKSTLLEAIAVACGFNPEGGSRNFNFSTRASHSELHQYLRIAKGPVKPKTGFFLRSESFFNVATNIEQVDPTLLEYYGGISLHEQSHGEAFWALFMHRFGPNGLYILDEPEAALSPTRQMAMLTRMHELVNQGSQFIVATHSPIVMAYPDAFIYELSENGMALRKYTETENFRVSHQFINNHVRMVNILMGQED